MATKNLAAFGIYPDQSTFNSAIGELRSAGFRDTDVSVLYPENLGSKDFGHEKHTKAPEGALAGGSAGGVLGAALGWLLGVGSLAVSGLEVFAVAGPILGTLSGLGAGVMLGGLSGALLGAGIPEYEAKRYEGRVRRGGILVSIHCDNVEWAKTARSLLKRTGAVDISTTGEAKADFGGSVKPMSRRRLSGNLQEQ